MLRKIKNNKGFTIVETLIVLAIAGLIILIVLLAVPALQRTSRNTNIKSDASAIAGGVSEFEGNNDGGSPTTFGQPAAGSGAMSITGVAGTVTAVAKIQASDVINQSAAAAVPVAPTSIASGNIDIVVGQTCSLTKSSRAFAIYYPIEASGGIGAPSQNDCVDT